MAERRMFAKTIVDSGVVVIRHWKVHNYIKVYFMRVDEPSTPRGRSVDEPSTQVRVGKDSIDKDSLVKGRGGAREASPATSSPDSSAVPRPI